MDVCLQCNTANVACVDPMHWVQQHDVVYERRAARANLNLFFLVEDYSKNIDYCTGNWVRWFIVCKGSECTKYRRAYRPGSLRLSFFRLMGSQSTVSNDVLEQCLHSVRIWSGIAILTTSSGLAGLFDYFEQSRYFPKWFPVRGVFKYVGWGELWTNIWAGTSISRPSLVQLVDNVVSPLHRFWTEPYCRFVPVWLHHWCHYVVIQSERKWIDRFRNWQMSALRIESITRESDDRYPLQYEGAVFAHQRAR